MDLSDLKEISDFEKYRSFIKDFIVNCEPLFRLIWFSNSNPLDELNCPLPDDPYRIFPEDYPNIDEELTREHGVVLFRRKDDKVQSREGITILVDCYSAKLGNSYFLDDLFILFRIILKGTNVQTLSNGMSRHRVLAKLVDDNFNKAMINKIDTIDRLSYKDISLNEENSGYLLTYSCRNWSTHLTDNKNYMKRMYGK